VRSVGVFQAIWAPAAAEAPAAVKETILECGQTTSVSIPSTLLVEVGAGAGLLRSRAGTVKERRPLCSGGGACSGVLEGASEDDMVNAHACISKSGCRATCRPQNTNGDAVVVRAVPSCYCALLAVESLVEAEKLACLALRALGARSSFTRPTALQRQSQNYGVLRRSPLR
jgi:hypothetical protein